MNITTGNFISGIRNGFLKYVPWVLTLICLMLFLFEKFEGTAVATANLDSATEKRATYKNELGTLTTTIKTLQLDKKLMQEVIFKKDVEIAELAKEFARVQSVVKIGSATRLPEMGTKFTEQIPAQPCDSVKSFEKMGAVAEKWYHYQYRITPDSLQLKNFIIPTETTVITGVKCKWLLGKETITTDITNTNPYVQVTSITSAQLVVPAPWYKKWYLWLAAGLAGGLLLK